jgi:hypothetical protein
VITCTKTFQFFNQRKHFYFRISVQLTLHMFRPRPGHHQAYTDKFTSLFTGPFGIITEHMQQDNNNNRIWTSTFIQNQLPAILTIFNNFNDFNNFQRHSALYTQFIVLYFTLLMQDKYYIHQDISRKSLKKLCIPVIVNVTVL